MELTPKQTVSELDKYIVGQSDAKRAVAVALRNRYRRSQVKDAIKDEITPKNIIMKGPTGVGKTEIARRLSKLVNAPFVKVEATKFTEVGYVGRDVESMVRDLVENSIMLVKKEKYEMVRQKSEDYAQERIVDYIFSQKRKEEINNGVDDLTLKANIRAEYKDGKLDDEFVEIEVKDVPKQINVMNATGMEINVGDLIDGVMGKQRRKKKKAKVSEAREILIQEESDKLIDLDSVQAEALHRAEQNGIIFIDEIDKITGKGNSNGPDVSREGVQRDILPLVEGCTISTKYGPIKTDYILFIAAGAFHISKIEDLIPELQGRFPVVVELDSLKAEDFEKILTDTENSLLLQYKAMLKVDNIQLDFKEEAIKEMCKIAEVENETSENIGARRLHNILEKLLEDISFNASGDHPVIKVNIDKEYINKYLSNELKSFNLKKYIL